MKKGFTLIEIIIVVGIFSILAGAGMSLGTGSLTRSNVRTDSGVIASSLSLARTNSIYGKNGSLWGVRISSGQALVFSGDSYNSRDTSFDESYNISSSLNITPVEIVFDKNGEISESTTINISAVGADTKTITVEQSGVIND